ncbi:MAG TPA: hypothetical protein PK402_03255 [Tepidisphaeraceae bacterium]|nr:hypothetical protein [Tepidisphaeraceae bacterium]
MSEPTTDNFDDPALKGLLKRASENHRASDELRLRAERILSGEVAGMITQSQPAQPQPAQPARRSTGRSAMLAIAALLVFGVGVWIANIVLHRMDLAHQAQYVADNRTIIEKMGADSLARPSSIVSELTTAEATQQLSQQLTRLSELEVRVPKLDDVGYELNAGSIVTVNNARCARLDYLSKDGKTITVYTLPTSAFQKVDAGDIYSHQTDDRLVAGHVGEDAVRCIVTERNFNVQQAFGLLERFKR